MELVLSCDIRFAAAEARFGLPEVNAGVIAGSGGCWRLARLVGEGRELVFSRDMISPARRGRWRPVNRVVPSEDLMAEVRRFAEKLLAKAPQALGIAKLLINGAAHLDATTARILDRMDQSVPLAPSDAAEGGRAFRAKRPLP